MKRAAGILLPITSLPSPYGVGTLGRAAYAFVDFLALAKQRYWQILPLAPTGYGDSPYQSTSAFAGNPYLIDLDMLAADGLLTADELAKADMGDDPALVDYGKLYANRFVLLRQAFSRFDRRKMLDSAAAQDKQSDYALFAALKEHFGGCAWTEWPDAGARQRRPETLARYRDLLSEQIAFQHFLQYQFSLQWEALKAYAASRNVAFIGDVAIYVPLDSCEVWEHPELFLLDEKGLPTLVAGVPPDSYTDLGQLWGTPIYDWKKHEAEDFGWWRARIRAAAERYDIVRIDHFRGIESYWAVPFGSADARPGQWYPGPGLNLVKAIKAECVGTRIIAEDLGYFTQAVKALLSRSRLPGMRVMMFGFDPGANSRDLPHNYPVRCVAYTSTHDSSPVIGFLETCKPEEAAFAAEYLGLNEKEGLSFGFIRALYESAAALAIVPMQDVLGQGESCRINLPGTLGWWRWRLLPNALTPALARRLARFASMSGRG